MVVAAFDFDGTLTRYDSLLPFLWYLAGGRELVAAGPALAGAATRYLTGGIDRQGVKEALLRKCLQGRSRDDLSRAGREFAAGGLNRLLRPRGMSRLRWHIEQGHRCILVSASLDTYLEPWASRHQFAEVACSGLEFDDQNRATGSLLGANCRGAEKARRLEALLAGCGVSCLYAYGDSAGDKELLEMADFGYFRRFA
jgi:phosphatidylglycerophosphatase C